MEMNIKDFEYLIEKAKSCGNSAKVVIANAEAPNILAGAILAKKEGIATPILLGNEEAIKALLVELGENAEEYKIIATDPSVDTVQYAIDMIKAGEADILMRGNTQTRDFLMPIINKSNHLRKYKLFTQVDIFKIPGLEKPIAISDTTILVDPSTEQHEEVIRNMVRALRLLGVERPNIAILSLVEVANFHMKDTLEATNLVYKNKTQPFADCNLVGPIPYDLIVSKEAAKVKNYNCEHCGAFDGILVPDLKSGNLMVKVLEHSAGAVGFGIIMGASIPIAITSRSDAPEKALLSIAAARVMLGNGEE